MLPIAIAVFASGRGSNFRALNEDLSADAHAPARIVLCVSNNPDPGAFAYAREQGIRTLRLSPKMFESEAEYDAALLQALAEHSIGLIVLAGYMRRIPPRTVERFAGRILNVHPALLPRFGGQGMYGMNVHAAVIEAGESESGATVHLVDTEYDTGPVLAQERVAVHPGDTPEMLAARVLEAEHRILPRVVREMALRLQERLPS